MLISSCSIRLPGDVEFPTDDHDRKKVLLVLAASLSIPSNLS